MSYISFMTDLSPDQIIASLGAQAKAAARSLRQASTAQKNAVLVQVAQALCAQQAEILSANALDMAAAEDLTAAQRDRLRLDPTRIGSMAKALELIATLPDPVGETTASWTVPSGLKIARKRVPLGVIGVIYESRPNVTADAAALCLKSGNATILRTGSEAIHSSSAIAALFAPALKQNSLPEACVQLVPTTDRTAVGALLQAQDSLDVIIPRGGKSLIARVQSESRVPVLAHLDGNCHVYVHHDADLTMATRVALNAKMRRTGVCGAMETLLIDRKGAERLLSPLVHALLEAGCALRGCDEVQRVDPRISTATEADWGTEYLDAILAVKLVDGVDAAIAHIEQYGSHHTDAIITPDSAIAAKFLNAVDSAITIHNASTQFADGGEFGMGAEIGIATGRLHARGPVGLEQLTTYKYVVLGEGQVRS
jgi:glutamate-5-semialdehyde dehydrogenase